LIIDEFIKTYIDSADPSMKEAAEELRKHASQELVGRMLSTMHTIAAVGYGLNNWGFIASKFQSTWAKIGGVPAVVVRVGALAVVSTLMMFFGVGSANWNSLTGT